ncbi:MAG: N-acetylmuramoyl-L-alanine amidase [Brevinema sp.]
MKKWYQPWNGLVDKNHKGKPCMIHTPVINTSKNETKHWAQDIASWHVMLPPKGRGWKNPGYLFVIERDGSTYYCPETSLNQCHCQHGGNNRASFGVCLVGDGSKQKPTMAQLSSLSKVINSMHSKEIRYHRDFSPKECPGDWVIDTIQNSPLASFVKRY